MRKLDCAIHSSIYQYLWKSKAPRRRIQKASQTLRGKRNPKKSQSLPRTKNPNIEQIIQVPIPTSPEPHQDPQAATPQASHQTVADSPEPLSHEPTGSTAHTQNLGTGHSDRHDEVAHVERDKGIHGEKVTYVFPPLHTRLAVSPVYYQSSDADQTSGSAWRVGGYQLDLEIGRLLRSGRFVGSLDTWLDLFLMVFAR